LCCLKIAILGSLTRSLEGLTALQASLMANPNLNNKPAVIEEISNQISDYKKIVEEQGKEFDTTFSLENVLRSDS
jgi:hypothetical protein